MQNILYVIIGALVLVGGGWLVAGNASSPAQPEVAMQKEAPHQEGMMDGEKMMKEDTMMDKAGMMKDDAMMEKGDMMKPAETAGDTMKKGDTMKDADAMMSAGSYEVYAPEKIAKAEKGKVVLFFHASWCPSCRTVDADIRAHLKEIPTGVTILDVDYDTAAALKQKYGVTYQHTFVQVDAQGNQLAKWSASPTLSDIVSHLK
ncbi:MAG: hypothetical protein RLZZ342_767 [Candidatus Parcubacteria bacterium]|jgi:thiol-disulfide isomerase/thioredoxin